MELCPGKSIAALTVAIAAVALALAASPAVPAASASACGPAADASPDRLAPKEAREAIVCLLNQERGRAGMRALQVNKKLQRAAQRHNSKMDGTGCFDHQCSGEGELQNRLEGVGYLAGGLTRWVYGENIAWGMYELGTPRSIVGAWISSPPHRANILNPSFREIGVGFSIGTPSGGSAPGGIYTTDFGLRVG